MFNYELLNQLYDGINPLQNEFEVWSNEKSRYRELKYHQNMNSDKEKEIHKVFMSKIYESICDKLTYKDMSAYAMWLDIDNYKNYLWSKFVVKILTHSINIRDQNGEAKGFFWKIFSPEKKVIHHLIGTVHSTTKKIATSPVFKKILNQSQQLFTESNFNPNEQDTYNFSCVHFKDPLRFSIDDELKKIAFEMNIPIQGLDIPEELERKDSRKNFFNKYQKLKNSPSFQANPKYFPSILGNILLIAEAIPVVDKWYQGIDTVISNYEDPIFLVGKRNIRWLNECELEDVSGQKYCGLIDLIQNTETPTCIAVGAGHYCGDDSRALLNAFEKEGFIIERVKSEDLF